MKILFENNKIIDENRLFEDHTVQYASVFNKISVYERRALVASMSESKYFRSRFGYNPDIMFSIEERETVSDMFYQFRAHLYEQMQTELAEFQSQAINEGIWGDLKNGVKNVASKTKDAVKNKINDIEQKYKAGIDFLSSMIDKGVDSVKKLMEAIGKLFEKLGESLSEALSKLGAFNKEKNELGPEVKVDKVYTENINQQELDFFGYVVSYINELETKNPDKLKKLLNEGVIDKIANNKFMQFILCYGKDRKISIWKSILISITGSFIISVILPVVLYAFNVREAGSEVICTSVALIWQMKGIIRIFLNRYVNRKEGEKFFNRTVCICLVICIVPLSIVKIPWVQEHLQSALVDFLKFIHADYVIDKVEDFLGKIIDHFTGKNPTILTTKESGEWMKQQIESYRAKGTTASDLLKGGEGAHKYINGLFGNNSDLTKFSVNSGELKTWMEKIADAKWTNSMQMLNSIPSLSSNAPLTSVLDGDTFKHVSRSALEKAISKYSDIAGVHADLINVSCDSLRDATDSQAGTSFAVVMDANATSENAAVMNDILRKVAGDMGIHKVTSFGEIVNVLKDSDTVWHDGPVNHKVIHTLFDTIVKCFNPVFIPFFDKDKLGKYKLSLGSSSSGYPAYPVTEVKMMDMKEVSELDSSNAAIPLLIKHLQDVQQQHMKDLRTGYKEEKEENNGKVSTEGRKFFKFEIKKYNSNSNYESQKLAVIFVSGEYQQKDNDGKKKTVQFKNQPAVAIDVNTLMCADIAPWFSHRRKQPYFMKGLFARLDFIPVKNDDDKTKEFIHNMLDKTFETACKQCVSFGTGNMYVVKGNDGKYVPVDESKKHEKYFDIGNLTSSELCDVLNGKIEAYSLMDAKYSDIIDMKQDSNGNLTNKSRSNNKIIENKRYKRLDNGKFVEDKEGQYDFVDAKIIPFISDKQSTVYKELKEDPDVSKILFDDKGEIDTDIFMNKELDLKRFMFRPMMTFGKDDKLKLAEGINKYLKGKDKKTKINEYKVLKKMIEIIWRNLYARIRKTINTRTGDLK